MDPSLALETAPPPALESAEAQRLTERIFRVTGDFTRLDSERDQNFHVETGVHDFVLKISNPAEDSNSIDLQTEALLHAARTDPELPVPRVVPTTDGATRATVTGTDGRACMVRLLTYVPGRMVRSTDLDESSLCAYGACVAQVGQALRGLFHPAAGRVSLFDLKHLRLTRPMVKEIDDGRRRTLASQVFDLFEHDVLPTLPALRAQVIHNDMTLENVLFDDDGRVTGVVDFGDAVHTALVCDLSSALASLLLRRPDPVAAAAAVVNGYRARARLEAAEIEMIPDLLAARLAMSAAWAAWRVRRFPDNADYVHGMIDGVWPLLGWLAAVGKEEMASAFTERHGRSAHIGVQQQPTGDLLDRRKVFGSALEGLTYHRPLHPVRGDGVWMTEADGNRCLDAYNNVPHVGHCHPRVVAAVTEQTRLLNTNTRYLHEASIQLAERLTATTPGLDVCMLVNSGSEASDLAWQLATAYTGRRGALVTGDAYHGFTAADIDISPAERGSVVPPTHVETFPAPDDYRGRHRRDDPGWADRYLLDAEAAIAALDARGISLAACFADTLFTSDGILVPPPTYVRELVRRVHEAGALFVADEVQGGFGRVGTHLWSFQTAAIEPDIVVLGKPMGNGYPVGAVLTRSEIVDRFARDRSFFSTFGGNPVAAAASLAVLDVLEEEGLQAHAAQVGNYVHAQVELLADRHEVIGDIRSRGLLLGIDLVTDRRSREPASGTTRAVLDRMRERGVLVGSTGPHGNVLKIRPPLVFSHEHADILINTLDTALCET
jgi:4-aminobutyrate aminotransferase-like enzyme/Ser/Thr protein kinase RdoA (MazF antagonist)